MKKLGTPPIAERRFNGSDGVRVEGETALCLERGPVVEAPSSAAFVSPLGVCVLGGVDEPLGLEP